MKDKLSALLDGDLDEQSTQAVFDSLRRDRDLRVEWETYCVIGDVLRGDGAISPGFVGRVMEGLDDELTLLRPPKSTGSAARRTAWRNVMPLAASVTGVAAVGWVAFTLSSTPDKAAAVATARIPVTQSVPVSVRPPVSSPQADPTREYLFAHQAMTGGGPIAGLIQQVRTVSGVRQEAAR